MPLEGDRSTEQRRRGVGREQGRLRETRRRRCASEIAEGARKEKERERERVRDGERERQAGPDQYSRPTP